MTIKLDPNATLYFMCRSVLAFIILGLVFLVMVFGHPANAPVNNNSATQHVHIVNNKGVSSNAVLSASTPVEESSKPGPARKIFALVVYVILGTLIWIYNNALVKSYQIELRPEGIKLHYGVVTLKNEILLFSKIQDIVINRNIIERMLGLSSLVIQNAMGTPENIPGLSVSTAEETREKVLSYITR